MENIKIKKVNYVDFDKANAVDIIEVAYALDLNPVKKGSNYFILCPNHIDKHATNCSLSRKKNMFKCFSCGKGGGPVRLVMDVKHCEFKEALQFIGERFGLVEEVDFAVESKGRGWQGLTQAEYEKFGLKNAYIENVSGMEEDEFGEEVPVIESERCTLRDLAKEDPEMHDTILIGKFSEKVFNLLNGYELIKNEKLNCLEDMYDEPNKSILLSKIKKGIEEYKSLLKKGLMNPERYFEVCEIEIANDMKVS